MIKVCFIYTDDLITGFCISGHSGYSEQGTDIVCASVSSAAYMAVNTVADVIGDRARASVSEGEMRFTVDNPSASSVALLKGLVIHLEALKEQYPKYIKVIILKHKNGGKSNA